jgi:hypothetical protein
MIINLFVKGICRRRVSRYPSLLGAASRSAIRGRLGISLPYCGPAPACLVTQLHILILTGIFMSRHGDLTT